MTNSTMNNRILIVDDNPAIHEDYKKILQIQSNDEDLDELSALVFGDEVKTSEAFNFELISAHQGQEAFELVKKSKAEDNPFAMAFVDMRMPPGWDGLQTIEHLWQVDPKLQVVICTAFSDYSWSEIVDRIAHRDRLLILKKPFDNIEVCQLAIALTQKWQLERQAENQMDSIVETAADGIITMTAEGHIESSNQAASTLFGYTRDEFLGMTFCQLLKDEEIRSWKDCLRRYLTDSPDKQPPAQDLNGVNKEGHVFPLLVSISRYDAHDGPRWTAILRDLTEYKQLQSKLQRARKLESVGQLAAGVAHEINTPMQFIYQNVEFSRHCFERIDRVFKAFDENLQKDGPSKPWEQRWDEMLAVKETEQYSMIRTELPEAIEECLDGVRRVVDIIQAMERFTLPGTEDFEPMDINKALKSATTVAQSALRKVALIDFQLEPGIPEVNCMGHEINQVLLNLIINAADAIAEKYGESQDVRGHLTLRTLSETDHVLISVEDDGCGISEDIVDRIYDPFFTTKDVGQGTGQGLALAYNAVQKHGGTIDFDSTPGEGTTFTIRLPWNCDTPDDEQVRALDYVDMDTLETMES